MGTVGPRCFADTSGSHDHDGFETLLARFVMLRHGGKDVRLQCGPYYYAAYVVDSASYRIEAVISQG